MGIVFQITVPGGAAHSLVSINVQHYATPGFYGLGAMALTPTYPSAPFPVAIVLVIVVVVVVALVVVFIVVKKKSK
jgi:hypothetical protein